MNVYKGMAVKNNAGFWSRGLTLGLLLGSLHACSGGSPEGTVTQPEGTVTALVTGPAAGELTEALFTAMGGREALEAAQVLVQQGSGIRNHLGQIPATGGTDPQGTLNPLVETIDLVNGRAAFNNTVLIEGGFAQQRTEAYTTYQGQSLGWGTTGGRPNIVTSVNGLFSWSTHNTPEFLTRRNPITIALAASNADASTLSVEVTLDGEAYWSVPTMLNGESLTLLIDKESSLLRGFTAIDTESMRGDQNATYLYGNYQTVIPPDEVVGVYPDGYPPPGALLLPHSVEIRHGDGIFASLQYDSITLNDASALAIFEIPADVRDQADQVVAQQGRSWVPLEWVDVAPGVSHIVAFSHHSMVVEFPSFVVVVEGPYTEGQSLTLARMVQEKLEKPIRYVAPTHPHHDHTGGLRGFASVGAAVLTAAGHEAEIRGIVESPHSSPRDALAENIANGVEVGHVEVFSGMTDITEGDQQVLLYEVSTIPHVNPKVLAYVPSSKVLFQSDLFFGGPGPDSTALYQAIVDLGLEVELIVGGHGGVLPFATLETAVNASN